MRDVHVAASSKDGSGIVIRKISRKRPRQPNSTSPHFDSSDDADRKEEGPIEMHSSTATSQDQKESASSNANTIDSEDMSATMNVAMVTRKARTSTNDVALKSQPGRQASKTNEGGKSNMCAVYLPRPGDVCLIRYDCYLLSSLELSRDRHGRLRVSESQNFQNRQRKWLEGNFNEPTPSTRTESADDDHKDDDTDGKRYTYIEDPYSDGENNDRCKLKLPALEFEIGAREVIRGLEVVVQRMVEGEIVEATIPHLYAYGYQGLYPRIPPKTDLFFVVKLELVRPSASNIAKAAISNDRGSNSYTISRTRIFTQDLIMFCCGLFEGTFMVLFGIAIPVFLLLRSELDLEEIIRDLASPSR